MGERLEEDPALKERSQALGTARVGRPAPPSSLSKYVFKKIHLHIISESINEML